MNTKIITAILSTTMALAVPLELKAAGPKVFGKMSVGAVEDEVDFESEAFELELGVKGVYQLDEFKAVYQLIVDFSDAANGEAVGGVNRDTSGEADIHVRRASVAFPGPYGTFVLAPRAISGHWRNIYGGLDKFEYNESHAETPAAAGKLFEQSDEGKNVIAYVTPNWNGFQAMAASLQVNENNDEDHDVISMRAIYWGEGWNVGIGHIIVDEKVGPPSASEDYVRDSIGFAYNVANYEFGGTYEMNRDRFGGDDSDVFGVAGKVKFGKGWSASLGYIDKDYDDDTKGTDNNLTVLNFTKKVHEKVSLWVEAGQYDTGPDNVAAGVNISF